MILELLHLKGKAYISRTNLAVLLNIAKQRIVEYEKPQKFTNPLQRADIETSKKGKEVYYDLLYAIDWYKDNVKTSYTRKEQRENSYVLNSGSDEEQEDITDNTPITPANMKTVREYEEAKRARIQRKKEAFELRVKKGEYIKIDDKDRSDATLMSSMLETFKQVEDNLPKEVVNIDNENTIKKRINRYFIKTINELKDKLSKVKVEYED